MLADPKFSDPAPLRPERRDDSYGIEREGDNIVVMLGPVPPFRLPVDAAEKMALLILKKCREGVDGQEIVKQTDGRNLN